MDQQKIFVQIALNNWYGQIARAEKTFSNYKDAEFYKEVAPGKNRIIYLYGHLAAYHDALKETLGIGKRSKPELAAIFLQNPDNAGAAFPPIGDLKEYWAGVHNQLKAFFDSLPEEDWFKRHNAMTDEDFAKDPTRNRLSVLLSRANHVAYHIGQIVLVKPENV